MSDDDVLVKSEETNPCRMYYLLVIIICGINFWLPVAEAAGYSMDQCCQAPQPSICPMIFDPLVCGTKACPYDNECIASLAGYTPDQCSPAPPECPVSTDDCSGDPDSPYPYVCGPNRCSYAKTCEATGAGFDVAADCCQDTQEGSICTLEMGK